MNKKITSLSCDDLTPLQFKNSKIPEFEKFLVPSRYSYLRYYLTISHEPNSTFFTEGKTPF